VRLHRVLQRVALVDLHADTPRADVLEQLTRQGRPLMWIPTSKSVAPLGGERRKRMRSNKKLTFATVNGTPLAFDAADKSRDRKPLYIGVPRVVIPKKFHLNEIIEQNAEKIGEAFIDELKDID